MGKKNTSKLIPEIIQQDLISVAKEKHEFDRSKFGEFHIVAKLLKETAKDNKSLEHWEGKANRILNLTTLSHGATDDTRNVIAKSFGYADWNTFIKDKYKDKFNGAQLNDLLDIEKKQITLQKQESNDNLPINLKLINNSEDRANTYKTVRVFKDFLDSNFLPYLSRENFKRGLSVKIDKTFLTESELLEILCEGKYLGLILHGQGGIGKTRLMMELGKRLYTKGHKVIEVVSDFENFEKLVEFLNNDTSKRYVLLFDYIEEQKIFKKVINWIGSNKSDTIKVIGNCRNGYLTEIQDFNDYLCFIDIGTKNNRTREKNEFEYQYKRKIIDRIIDSINNKALSKQLLEPKLIKTFYQAKPSFAAFIKYLYHKNPLNDFNISVDTVFSQWLFKKLRLTINDTIAYSEFFDSKRMVFLLLSSLPANHDSVAKLKSNQELRSIIVKLIKDGWVDEVNNDLRVVHDTVNDTLFLAYLKNCHFDEYEILDFLSFSLKYNSFSSMMRAIERIWEEIPEDRKKKINKQISNFIDDNVDEILIKNEWFKYKIDTTQTITEEYRINFFHKYRKVLTETINQEKFGSSLGFSMQWVHENINKPGENEKLRSEYSIKLKQLFFEEWNINDRFDTFVNDTRAAKIISSYINLLGIDEYIIIKFYEFISKIDCNTNNLELISIVLVSWLEKGGEITPKIRELTETWLDFQLNYMIDGLNPGYLISAWIKKGGINDITSRIYKILINTKPIFRAGFIEPWIKNVDNVDVIEPFICETLQQEITSTTSCYIIGYWLQKSSNPLLVKPFLLKWFADSDELKMQYIILLNWFIKGDDADFLLIPLKKWLENRDNQEHIGNLLCAFMDNKGNCNKIRDEVFEWLTYNSNDTIDIESTPQLKAKVIGHWLEFSEETDLVEPFVCDILQQEITYKSSYSIIGFWLQKSANPLLIKPFLLKWLIGFKETKMQSFILNYWLVNGDDPNFLIEPIKHWLKAEDNQESIGKILNKFIEKGGNFDEIKHYIVKWLTENPVDDKANFLLGQLLARIDKDKDKVILVQLKHIVEIVVRNANNQLNVGFTIGYWIEKGGEVSIMEPYLSLWLKEYSPSRQASKIIGEWLEAKGSFVAVKPFIIPCLLEFGREKNVSHLMLNWINHGDDPLLIKDFIEPYFEVDENKEYFENCILLIVCLQKLDKPDLVKAAIQPWLLKNFDKERSVHVFLNWLIKGNDYQLVEAYVKIILSTQSDKNIFFNVIDYWLLYTKNWDFVEHELKNYIVNFDKQNYSGILRALKLWVVYKKSIDEINLEKYRGILRKSDLEKFFIIDEHSICLKENIDYTINELEDNKYLNLSKKIKNSLENEKFYEGIKSDVMDYLQYFKSRKESSFVLACWIEKGNDFDMIKQELKKWLKANSDEREDLNFVVTECIKVEKGFMLAKPYAIKLLKSFNKSYELKYILSSWLALKGIERVDEIEPYIVYWVENLYNKERANWRDVYLLDYYRLNIGNKY